MFVLEILYKKLELETEKIIENATLPGFPGSFLYKKLIFCKVKTLREIPQGLLKIKFLIYSVIADDVDIPISLFLFIPLIILPPVVSNREI